MPLATLTLGDYHADVEDWKSAVRFDGHLAEVVARVCMENDPPTKMLFDDDHALLAIYIRALARLQQTPPPP